jgi:23S rRNA U2552 (ribose-2'-O)-methylase RlmE/FtsJ
MAKNLLELAQMRAKNRNEISKPDGYYKIYDEHFRPLRTFPLKIFEIGVYQGESTKVFADYFSRARIVGVDLHLPPIDLDGFDRITLLEGDQTDRTLLEGLADEHAPDGIDIVIEDAAHVGALSLATFEILFPRLRPGGLYVVEDWGTGYWPDRDDGATYTPAKVSDTRILSHSHGMVGFVKSLVDRVHPPKDVPMPCDVEALHVYPGVVILQKA